MSGKALASVYSIFVGFVATGLAVAAAVSEHVILDEWVVGVLVFGALTPNSGGSR